MIDQTQADIVAECDALKEMLLEKNRAYGDSALDPVRIFSKADTVEQIRVRIDDKLSRLKRGQAAGEDVERDLLGYLILLRIAHRRAQAPTARWIKWLPKPGETVRLISHPEVTADLQHLLAHVVEINGNTVMLRVINGAAVDRILLLPLEATELA